MNFLLWLCAVASNFEEADARARSGLWTQEEKEWVDFVSARSSPKEQFDGNEAQFHPEILQNPLEILGIVEVEREKRSTEKRLETCEESGDYEREFLETLVRQNVSVIEKAKICDGHTVSEKIKGSTKKAIRRRSEKRVSALKDSFAKNPSIQKNASFEIRYHKNHSDLIYRFHHENDVTSCDHFHEKILSETVEEQEIWESDDSTHFSKMIQNPHCRKMAVRPLSPTTRIVAFHCSPGDNSPCTSLRAQGAILLKKECLEQEEETGDCILWKKTFDCEKASISQPKHETREGKRKIFGLNGEFDTTYDKTSDFPKVFALLKSLSDMPLGEGAKIFDLTEDKPIFNGKARHCSCNHMIGELYDCCKTMTGVVACTEKEKLLRKMNDEGRCHQVGSYREGIFSNKKIRTFCCYPTKLLRIFNEQARKQMGRGWGSAKKPDCSGFSLDIIDSLGMDASLFDFSEAADELAVDEKGIMEKMAEELKASLNDPTWRTWE